MTEDPDSGWGEENEGWTLPGDDPATLDADIAEPWDEEPPEVELGRVRARVAARLVVFLVVAAVAGASVYMTRHDFAYFWNSEEDVVALGDLRARVIAGEKDLGAANNTYISVENQFVTYEAESESFNYFLDPLYFVITRTKRDLPEPEIRGRWYQEEVPEGLLHLLLEKHVYVEDFTTGFGGKGRLLRADLAPKWVRNIYTAYRDILRERPAEQVHIFLEGETTRDYWMYPLAYGLAILLVLMTGGFLVRAVVVYVRVRRQV